MAPLYINDIFRAISDNKSLVLFNTIALSSDDTSVLVSRLELTRKQYYSRMSGLVKAGLIIKRDGNYFLTSFGKVVYEAQMLIGKAKQNYWKLNAIDSIESSSHELTAEERSKIIDTLIDDNELKEILLGPNKNKAVEKSINQPLISQEQSLSPTAHSQQLNPF